MFRLKCFVEEIEKEYPNESCHINNFFQERGYDNYSSYASALSIIFIDYISSYTNHHKLKSGIKESVQTRKLFAPLMVNGISTNSYLELKTHPVYYFNGVYYVLHWNYFLSQIFLGTFMALKERLENVGYKDVKKTTGLIVERSLFKKVLTTSFSRSWQCFLFDDSKEGKPDALFKMGNNLFIIELKDSLMSENVMESFDYKTIENHIIRTFIQSEKKGKAVIQLTKYIKKYDNNEYEKDGFPYNKRLNIYPIIIYTDYKYRINGLNHFLSVKFGELINQKELHDSTIQRIRPLTVVGLDCMFNLQLKFHGKKLKFADAIDNYHKHIKTSVKKNENKGVVFFSKLYPSFDRYLPENRNILMSVDEIQLILKDFFNLE